jgi:hypothetical protein
MCQVLLFGFFWRKLSINFEIKLLKNLQKIWHKSISTSSLVLSAAASRLGSKRGSIDWLVERKNKGLVLFVLLEMTNDVAAINCACGCLRYIYICQNKENFGYVRTPSDVTFWNQ